MTTDEAITALHFALEDALEAGMQPEDTEREVKAFLEAGEFEDDDTEEEPALCLA